MSYYERALTYAASVLSGDIPACIYVHQACERFEKDLLRCLDDNDPLEFDANEAERWCRNVERLRHTKGKWQGNPFQMTEWQIFCTVNIFGFKLKGKRRYREVYIEVPRKNGKTLWISCIGLGMLTWDGEKGAEVYCGATNEKQAGEVYIPARYIALNEPDFREKYGIEVTPKSVAITIPKNGSKFEPIIGQPGDGASPSCGISDEFHEHPNSNQVDTIKTGMAAREQPLMIYITTAGADMGGPCYAKRDDIKNILAGTVEDDRIFGIIFTLDEEDQWDTIEAQRKANPSYDAIDTIPDYLEGELNAARRSAVKQVAYKTKHLNLWVGAKAAWMNMLAFQACRKKELNIEDYKGQSCIIGIDLASKVDIASMAILFPPSETHPKFAAFVKNYLPEDTIFENTRYQQWHAGGWLESTPGNVIDFSYIEEDLQDIARNHDVMEIAYDPFQATQFSTRMNEIGLPMVELGATVKNFSEPMKELEAIILKRAVEFNIDPVLLWMFGNVVAKMDKKDNIFPDKERYENKIDGVVALIMCVSRYLQLQPTTTSIYERMAL